MSFQHRRRCRPRGPPGRSRAEGNQDRRTRVAEAISSLFRCARRRLRLEAAGWRFPSSLVLAGQVRSGSGRACWSWAGPSTCWPRTRPRAEQVAIAFTGFILLWSAPAPHVSSLAPNIRAARRSSAPIFPGRPGQGRAGDLRPRPGSVGGLPPVETDRLPGPGHRPRRPLDGLPAALASSSTSGPRPSS